MNLSSSLTGFIGRGFDSKLALALIEKGYPLNRLNYESPEKLKELGLTEQMIFAVKDRSFIPIPRNLVNSLILKSHAACCVCGDRESGIAIYPFLACKRKEEYMADKLIVVCPTHQADLQNKRLGVDYTEESIKNIRDNWYKKVKIYDREEFLRIMTDPEGRWSYFNHQYLFYLAEKEQVDLKQLPGYDWLHRKGILDAQGKLLFTDEQKNFFYDIPEQVYLRLYMHELVCLLFKDKPFVDVTPVFTINKLNPMLSEGDYIGLQASFHIRIENKQDKGATQIRRAYIKRDSMRENIFMDFVFNPYECTNKDSYDRLRRKPFLTVIGKITRLERPDDKTMNIQINPVAIGVDMQIHSANENLRESAANYFNHNSLYSYF